MYRDTLLYKKNHPFQSLLSLLSFVVCRQHGFSITPKMFIYDLNYAIFVNLKILAGFNTLNDWKKTPLYIGTIKGKTNQEVNISFLEMMESQERKKDSDLINLRAMEYVWRTILKR